LEAGEEASYIINSRRESFLLKNVRQRGICKQQNVVINRIHCSMRAVVRGTRGRKHNGRRERE
jgi:hypothetical protein